MRQGALFCALLLTCCLFGCAGQDTMKMPVLSPTPGGSYVAPALPSQNIEGKAWKKNFDQSHILYDANHYDEARKLLNATVDDAKLDADNTVIYARYIARLGETYFFKLPKANYQLVIPLLEKALAIYAQAAPADRPHIKHFYVLHFMLGCSYLQTGKYQQGEKNLIQAMAESKKIPGQIPPYWLKRCYEELAGAYYLNNQPKDAAKVKQEEKKLFGKV